MAPLRQTSNLKRNQEGKINPEAFQCSIVSSRDQYISSQPCSPLLAPSGTPKGKKLLKIAKSDKKGGVITGSVERKGAETVNW